MRFNGGVIFRGRGAWRGACARRVLSACLLAALAAGAAAAGARGEAGGRAVVGRAESAGEGVTPAGDVLVVLNEGFLNALLDAVASQSNPPTFPLSRGKGKGGASSGGCASEITLLRESGGRRTAVRFRDGRVNAPVAFRGSYEAPLVGCLRFEGWADTVLNLAFDGASQALTARIEVLQVNLKNVPSTFSGGITGLVQDAIDERLNPVKILRAEQLAMQLPPSLGPGLRLRAREVRHEIVGTELRLRVVYEIVRAE